MNLVPSIAACMFTLVVTLLLPVGLLLVLARKYPRQGIVSAWFLGAAAMFVPQMLIRLPILNVLSAQTWLIAFSQKHILIFYLLLAFTAGLFELTGRYVNARLMAKRLTFPRALAAGLGHGGIESILLVGLTYVNNLILLILLQTGGYDALIGQLQALGQDASALIAVRDTLLQTHWSLFLLASLERLLTMVAQVAMTVLVCYGIHIRRPLPCCLVCLAFHTLLDSSVSLQLLPISQGAAYGLIYSFLAAMAALALYGIRTLRIRWDSVPAHPAGKGAQL